MNFLVNFLWLILALLVILLSVVALLSPFEALGWWSGWSKRRLAPETLKPQTDVTIRHDAGFFLVYLTGVLGFEGGSAGQRESGLVRNITERLPARAVVISDVFPYSVSNNPLNGERVFAAAWNWVDRRRRTYKTPVNPYSVIIVTRNLFQVAVSADPRYGPINNVGVAREIAASLLRNGYPPGSGKPIYIVGYSGGGQIAVGAARYLHLAFDAPIRIVSLGGVISDDPGIAHVDHLYHIQGEKDPMPWLGAILYPGRWPILPHSKWNQAKRAGRITVVKSGPMTHFGLKDYFARSTKFPDGTSYSVRTAELAARCILQAEQTTT
jgi:hypothetical protein